MKLIYIILLLLLIVVACVFGVFLVSEPVASTGLSHPTIDAIRSGGDGLARFAPVSDIALLMLSAIVVMFGTLLYLGVSERRRTLQCKAWIAAGTIGLLLIWWSIFGTYSLFLNTGDVRLMLGFPLPTAFTVYGLWLGGFVFVIAYVVGFRWFIYTMEDETAFHDLVEKYRRDRDNN